MKWTWCRATFAVRLAAIAEALFATEKGAPDPKRVAWVCADFADFVSRAQGRGSWSFF